MADDRPADSSWAPVDVAAVLAGNTSAIEPSHLRRADGQPLLYPGRVHSFHGEQESMKSWCAQVAIAEVLVVGTPALYVDCESEPRDVLGRLTALGVPEANLTEHLLYVRPEEALSDGELEALLKVVEARRPEVAVFDGVDAAMFLDGLNPDKDFRRWHGRLVRPVQLRVSGPTVLVDHVVKNKEARGDYAAGDRAKRSVIDGAAFGFEKTEDFGRGRVGVARLVLHKDRAGALRGRQGQGREIARLELTSHEDGRVSWQLDAPASAGSASQSSEHVAWQPTHLMERISRFLEDAEKPASMYAIEEAKLGKRDYVRQAAARLVSDGYVEASAGPRGGRLHRSVAPYREDGSSPRPDLAPTSPQDGGANSGETSTTSPRSGTPFRGAHEGEVDPGAQGDLLTADAPGRGGAHMEALRA